MPAESDQEARYKLAAALASGASVSAAARAAGYRRQHVYRLKKDPEFVKMLEAAKARLAEGPGPIVSDEDAKAAVSYLRGVVDGVDDGDPHRVNAAKALLSAAQVTKRVPPSRAVSSEAEEEAKKGPGGVPSTKELAEKYGIRVT